MARGEILSLSPGWVQSSNRNEKHKSLRMKCYSLHHIVKKDFKVGFFFVSVAYVCKETYHKKRGREILKIFYNFSVILAPVT